MFGTPPTSQHLHDAYALAQERYAGLGVDTDAALAALAGISLSLHCWQGDDVAGFESPDAVLGGGLAATGNYPGQARNAEELRRDLDCAYRLIPGTHRLNLHAIYAETAGHPVARDALGPEHFAAWVDWAKANQHGLDFNPTLFSHPLAAGGWTLASPDPAIRAFWVAHCQACRQIGAHFGRELGTPAATNIWIPDGFKDTPVDRAAPRRRLQDSLDAILAAPIDPRYNLDAVESKLFGLGSESYVAGSHEFYLGYAIRRQILLTLDSGHFHPTESVADKLSAVLLYVPGVVLHISRGVRWDSDHVVTLSDETTALLREVVTGGALDRVRIGLDFFDASINRLAAWTIGARNVLRAALLALLEPTARLQQQEEAGNYTARLAWLEELKGLPWAAVWDYYCRQHDVPVGLAFLDEVQTYETQELSKRASGGRP
ncbi:MAG TPA: L-rhamnose isomerase [Chloroflexia bacterium]|nr:L-rhamnose isomerase [Chloroflexia bacterium]